MTCQAVRVGITGMEHIVTCGTEASMVEYAKTMTQSAKSAKCDMWYYVIRGNNAQDVVWKPND